MPLALDGSVAITCCNFTIPGNDLINLLPSFIRIPGEYEPHDLTYMIWPGDESARWSGSKGYLKGLKNEIGNLAKVISQFEPVRMLVDPSQFHEAAMALNHSNSITLLELPVNDIWARDSIPVFGINVFTQSLIGVDLNYHTEWKNGQQHAEDGKIAERLLKSLKAKRLTTRLKSEGGALEFDGDGTLMLTESSIFNPDRNPGFNSLNDVERELKSVFQVKKVVWFHGIYGSNDSTDAHVDALARFVNPGVIALDWPPKGYNNGPIVCTNCSEQAEQVLKRERDAKGRKFQVTRIYQPHPDKIPETEPNNYENAWIFSYTNFLIVNGGVIVPQFGDEDADKEAITVVQKLFPDRRVVPASSVYIGKGGGAVHCVTRNKPRVLW